MLVDRYKSAARNLAWYDQDGEPTIHNPFKKFRRSPRRSNSIQLESHLAPARTADAEIPADEQRRNRELREGLGGPIHPDIYPPPTGMTADSTARTNSMDKPDPSMSSNTPINVTPRGHDGIESDGKPRKRKFLGMANHSDGDDREPPEDEPDKQRFTAVGQFKATVLNSWINILLLAAPVGSKSITVSGITLLTVSSCAELCQSRPSGCFRGQLYCHHVCFWL